MINLIPISFAAFFASSNSSGVYVGDSAVTATILSLKMLWLTAAKVALSTPPEKATIVFLFSKREIILFSFSSRAVLKSY